ncbi:MAG: pilus assembly protein [Gammaproteobacteria bacterium]|nr:pilus assembly protein [Gammaproteobacteria bacterium]
MPVAISTSNFANLRRQRGATAVEMAVLIGPLFIVIFVIVEASRFFYTDHQVILLADELARQTVIQKSNSPLSAWNQYVASRTPLLDADRLTLNQSLSSAGDTDYLKLSLAYEFEYLIPLVNSGTQTIVYNRIVPLGGF